MYVHPSAAVELRPMERRDVCAFIPDSFLAWDWGCLETKDDARMEIDASNDAALERV